MHGEHAAAGQGPVGHLDGAAGDGAPPLGRLARQVEARDAAGDPAFQAAGQRLERAIVAAQRAMADDVPEGRQPLQHLVRHVVQAGHRLVLVDPAAVALVEQRAVAHVVEHGAHGLFGEGHVAVRIVEALGEVVSGKVAGDLRARALALDVGEQADDDDEAQHDRRQPDGMPAAVAQHQHARHRQHQRGGRQRVGAPVEAARGRAAHDQAERQRPQRAFLLRPRQAGEEAAHQPVGERGRHRGDGVEPAPAGETHRRRIAPVDDLDPPRAPHRDDVDRRRRQEHPERRQAGIECRRRRAEDRQRQHLGQGRDLHQAVGDDLLDPLGIDAGDVQLGHWGMLEGRRIDRVSPVARFVSFVSPIRRPRHSGDTNHAGRPAPWNSPAPTAPSSSTGHAPDGHLHLRGIC